ncbi:MAG: hypothetical protein K2W82_12525 [Candidatus Obscuribacterales bacterium]|nr:hypothetical protein [Candidatus Obscuribacterales bacterium]
MQPVDPACAKSKAKVLSELCFILLIGAFTLIAFQKTVFQGQPISRLNQIAQRDSLFAKYFFPIREAYDQSTYQQHFPNYVFAARELKKGHLPIWNPLSGCGVPQLADYQASVFGPIRTAFLFLAPDLSFTKAWNLLLVFQLFILGTSFYVLARVCALRPYASVFAALTYAFCPLTLGMLDLTINCNCFTPLIMAAFIHAAYRQTLISKTWAAIACALVILSGHPEPPLFVIAFSSLLYAWLSYTGPKSIFKSLFGIAFVGLLSFCLTAFMLLPFLEFLRNSDCYKAGLEGLHSNISWNSIILNLVHPAYGNFSPFLGIVSAFFIPLAVLSAIKTNRLLQGLCLCLAIAALIMIQPGPLATLFSWKALSWFAPKYCWYTLLMFAALIAAFGFEEFVESRHKTGKSRIILLTISALLPAGLLIAAKLIPGLRTANPIDEVYTQLAIEPKVFTRDLILLGILFTAGLTAPKFGRFRTYILIAAVALISTFSLAPLAKKACPVQSVVEYDQIEPIPFLQQKQERVITMGRHVLCPNSNMVYGIADLVPANVFHPKRFQPFMVACGVTAEGVNQFFDSDLSPTIDLASIKYVLSPLPVLKKNESHGVLKSLPENGQYDFGQKDKVRLKAASLRYFPENGEVLGKALWQLNPQIAKDLAWQSVLLDERNNVIWFSDLERFEYMFSRNKTSTNQADFERRFCALVPTQLQKKEKLLLGVQLFDWRTNSVIKTDSPIALQNGTLIPLAMFSPDGKISNQNKSVDFALGKNEERQFKLVLETDKRIRLYENKAALPQAYVVHKAIKAKNDKEALQLIQAENFNPRQEVVLEDAVVQYDLGQVDSKDKITYYRPDPCTIIIDSNLASPGYLILTDTFYPGWYASEIISDQDMPLPILHANYLFRAVALPAGFSSVTFSFQPPSWTMGLYLGLGTIISIAVVLLTNKLRQKK